MGRHSVTDCNTWWSLTDCNTWWSLTDWWVMDIKLDVHTGLACSWSVVLIYNRDHGRWSQAECPDWSVQSRVCLMPQYSNASCTKLKSHVLLICEGPQGVTTWNVMYIYIYIQTENWMWVPSLAALRNYICSLVPRLLPSFLSLTFSTERKARAWEQGYILIDYITASDQKLDMQ